MTSGMAMMSRDGRFVLSGATIWRPGVVDAYRRAEDQRRERLSEFMTRTGCRTRIIREQRRDHAAELIAMTGVYARAG